MTKHIDLIVATVIFKFGQILPLLCSKKANRTNIVKVMFCEILHVD